MSEPAVSHRMGLTLELIAAAAAPGSQLGLGGGLLPKCAGTFQLSLNVAVGRSLE